VDVGGQGPGGDRAGQQNLGHPARGIVAEVYWPAGGGRLCGIVHTGTAPD